MVHEISLNPISICDKPLDDLRARLLDVRAQPRPDRMRIAGARVVVGVDDVEALGGRCRCRHGRSSSGAGAGRSVLYLAPPEELPDALVLGRLPRPPDLPRAAPRRDERPQLLRPLLLQPS